MRRITDDESYVISIHIFYNNERGNTYADALNSDGTWDSRYISPHSNQYWEDRFYIYKRREKNIK